MVSPISCGSFDSCKTIICSKAGSEVLKIVGAACAALVGLSMIASVFFPQTLKIFRCLGT